MVTKAVSSDSFSKPYACIERPNQLNGIILPSQPLYSTVHIDAANRRHICSDATCSDSNAKKESPGGSYYTNSDKQYLFVGPKYKPFRVIGGSDSNGSIKITKIF